MPDPNDILKAMRDAGEDFAKMADTIEGKLPGIAKALARAPRRLKPLVRDLKDAGELTNQFIESLERVNDVIGNAADGTNKLVRHFRFLRDEAGKTVSAVHNIAEKMNDVGDSLKNRTTQAAALSKEMKNLSKGADVAPNPRDEGPIADRNVAAGATGDSEKEAETIDKARAAAGEYGQELRQAKDQVKALELAMKAVGQVAAKSTEGFDAAQAQAYGQEISDTVAELQNASDVGTIDFVTQQMVNQALQAARALEELGDKASDMEVAEKTKDAEAAMRKLKVTGSGASRELSDGYKAIAAEARNWHGLSLKDEAAFAAMGPSIDATTKEMTDSGMNKYLARGISITKHLDKTTGGLGDTYKSLKSETQGFAKKLFGIEKMSLIGLAQSFVDIGDEIKDDRQQIMDLTSEAGTLSSMLQSGMGAGAIKGEFDKLRTSMNNLLNTWGKTREEVQGSMKTLTAAGFSMSELTGPTLKAGEGFTSLARSGEYAMSGMKQIAAISTITGKSMGDVANLAGQWREKMGVDISDVGNTYLELEAAAKKSGLAVGKFMDRIMASSAGFILMGGNMDDVANSLSNLMGGMDIPPGMAADIAGDFMDRMNKITYEDALMGVSMVGDAGAKLLQDAAVAFTDERKKEITGLEKDIAALDTADDKGTAAWRKRNQDLRGKLAKAEEDEARMSKLQLAAATGDRKAQAMLYQEMSRRGMASAAQVKVLADLASMGVDTTKLAEDEANVAKNMLDAMKEKEATGEGMILLEQQAKAAGYASYKEMEQVVKSMYNAEKIQNQFAAAVGDGTEATAKALRQLVKKGDVKGIEKALEGKDSGELDKMFDDMQAAGAKFSSSTLEALEAAGDDVEKKREILAQQIGQEIEVPEAQTLEQQAIQVAKAQLKVSTTISQYVDAIKKWGTPIIGLLMAIKLAQDVGAVKQIGGFKSLGKKFGGAKGMRKALTPLSKMLGKIPGVKGVQKVGAKAGVATLGKLGAGIGTKGLAAIAGKVAAPLALAAASYGLIKGIQKMSKVYGDAKKQALKDGKTEEQARKIAIKNLKTMDSAKDVISTGLSYIMGDWLAGKLTGLLTWIPGFEGAWGAVVDIAMGIADGFVGLWDVVKVLSQAIWWLLKPVRVLATFVVKYLLAPFRMIGTVLGMLGKIVSNAIKFWRGVFSLDTGMMADALSGMGEAIWDAIKGLAGILLDTFKDIPLYIWDSIKFLGKALKAVFWDLPLIIDAALAAIPGLIWDALTALPGLIMDGLGAIAGLGGILIDAFAAIPGLIWDALSALPGLIMDGLGAIAGIGGILLDVLKAVFWDLPGLIIDAFAAIPGLIWDALTALPGLIMDGLGAIAGLGGAIWDWIASVPGAIASSIGDIGKRFKDWLKDALPWPLSSIFGGGGDDEEVEAKEEAEAKESLKKANEELAYQKDYEAGMAPDTKKRLEQIRADRAARKSGAPEAGPFETLGIQFDAPTGVVPPDLMGSASDLAAAKAAAGDTSAAGVTDNSQWQVHINTRSEKEMEQAMLKTLQKHQQKLQN